MLDLFSDILKRQCGFQVDNCGTEPHTFVYLNDAIFSGGRVKQDLVNWIKVEAPDKAKIHIIVIASHQGSYYNRNKINEAIKLSDKKISLRWWHGTKEENF